MNPPILVAAGDSHDFDWHVATQRHIDIDGDRALQGEQQAMQDGIVNG